MNVTDKHQFQLALEAITRADVVVLDTETNTLKVRQQDKMPLVSIQAYLPDTKESFNFAFRHGYGDILTSEDSPILVENYEPYVTFEDDGTSFTVDPVAQVTGRDRRSVYWMRLYEFWMKEHDAQMGNLPIEWLDSLKRVMTPDKLYIFHNMNFDLAVMEREGFTPMNRVHDTMIALQMIWGDWGGKRNADDKGIRVKMPTRYYDPDLADKDGMEWGNRRLKWQARFWDLDDADAGENDLAENAKRFVYEVCEYAVKCVENDPNLHDYLFPLGSYASWRKNPELVDNSGNTWHDRQVADLYSKVSWNDKELKGRLWMLPSEYVATYGELDVILTWGVYEKCATIMSGWDTTDVFEEISDINLNLCWRMEREGVRLDIDEAKQRIEANYAEAQAIMDKYDWNIDSWQEFKAHVGDYLGLPDTQAHTVQSALEWIDPSVRYADGIWGHEAIQVIKDRLAYKRIIKQTSTYLVRWVNAADPNGYGHFYIDAAGTKTGRASSGGDMGNGQNIPDRTTLIKEVIIVPDNHVVFGVDYSNLELRIAAWIAEVIYGFGNQEMTNNINSRDAHAYTAKVLGVRDILYPNMTDEEIAAFNKMPNWEKYKADGTLEGRVFKAFLRQVGKTANFNLIYGGSFWSLGIQLGESMETKYSNAKKGTPEFQMHWDILRERFAPYEELHAKWHSMYPAFEPASEFFESQALERRPTPAGVGAFQYTMVHLPYYRTDGLPVTDYRLGRPIKHHLYDTARWMPKKHGHGVELVDVKAYSAKKAWNNKVQGTAGHICLHSGNRYYKLYNPTAVPNNLSLFVQIHDALDGYCPTDKLHQVKDLMEVMTDWNVEPKLEVELEAGLQNWQHMKEVKNIDLWIDSKGREGYE